MSRHEQQGTFSLLAKILENLPKMSDAACIGRAELFDERGHGESTEAVTERHGRAIALCQRCPELAACRAFAATEKAAGMVRAGVAPTAKETR